MNKAVKNIRLAGAEMMLRKICGDDCTINIRQHRFISLVNGRVTSNEQWRVNVETYDRLEVDSGQYPRLDRCVQAVCREIVSKRVALTHSRRRTSNVATDRR